MDFKSNTICCKVVLTHEDALSIQRYLNGVMHGGAMHSHDLPVVQTFMAGLVEHEDMITDHIARTTFGIAATEKKLAEEEAELKLEEAAIRTLRDSIQRIDVDQFMQVKDIYQVSRD